MIANNTSLSTVTKQSFKLANLDEPIAPCTPDLGGVQVIAVGIVFLALVPGVVDLETPHNQSD